MIIITSESSSFLPNHHHPLRIMSVSKKYVEKCIDKFQSQKSQVGTQVQISDLEFSLETHFPTIHPERCLWPHCFKLLHTYITPIVTYWRSESSNISLVVLDKLLYYSRNLSFWKIRKKRTDRQTNRLTDLQTEGQHLLIKSPCWILEIAKNQ